MWAKGRDMHFIKMYSRYKLFVKGMSFVSDAAHMQTTLIKRENKQSDKPANAVSPLDLLISTFQVWVGLMCICRASQNGLANCGDTNDFDLMNECGDTE